MNQSLAVSNNPRDIVTSMSELMQLSAVLVKSGMLPNSIKSPEAAAAIMLKGRELGIGPMEAFSSINVIQGKPTISPQLMIALSSRSGQLEDFIVEDDGTTCKVTVWRKGRKPHSAVFGMAEAKGLGLAGKDNWLKQPKVMRQWRAISAAFRVVFADVLAGLYTPEELGAEVSMNDEGEVVDVHPTETQAPTAVIPTEENVGVDFVDPTEGLYTNESRFSAKTISQWTSLVKDAIAAGVVMNYNLDEMDDKDTLTDRIRAVKSAIEARAREVAPV